MPDFPLTPAEERVARRLRERLIGRGLADDVAPRFHESLAATLIRYREGKAALTDHPDLADAVAADADMARAMAALVALIPPDRVHLIPVGVDGADLDLAELLE